MLGTLRVTVVYSEKVFSLFLQQYNGIQEGKSRRSLGISPALCCKHLTRALLHASRCRLYLYKIIAKPAGDLPQRRIWRCKQWKKTAQSAPAPPRPENSKRGRRKRGGALGGLWRARLSLSLSLSSFWCRGICFGLFGSRRIAALIAGPLMISSSALASGCPLTFCLAARTGTHRR